MDHSFYHYACGKYRLIKKHAESTAEAKTNNFSKIALNRVLIRSDARSRRELSVSGLGSKKGAFYVELLPFYCKLRTLVPMSDIAFLDIHGNFAGNLNGYLAGGTKGN